MCVRVAKIAFPGPGSERLAAFATDARARSVVLSEGPVTRGPCRGAVLATYVPPAGEPSQLYCWCNSCGGNGCQSWEMTVWYPCNWSISEMPIQQALMVPRLAMWPGPEVSLCRGTQSAVMRVWLPMFFPMLVSGDSRPGFA